MRVAFLADGGQIRGRRPGLFFETFRQVGRTSVGWRAGCPAIDSFRARSVGFFARFMEIIDRQVLIVFLVAIVAALILSASRPTGFRIERENGK